MSVFSLEIIFGLLQLYRSKTDGYQNQPAVRVGSGQRGPLRGGPGSRYPENSPVTYLI